MALPMANPVIAIAATKVVWTHALVGEFARQNNGFPDPEKTRCNTALDGPLPRII
jgi:hypothetical protein